MEHEFLWPRGNAVSCMKLLYQSRIKSAERPKITSPHDAVEIFRRYWDHTIIGQREEFKCIFLTHQYQVLAVAEIGIGDNKSITVNRKLIFSIAYQLNANLIIGCHDHPSGFVSPSNADKSFTRRLRLSAHVLNFGILDQIIISPYKQYFSFVAHDLIPWNKNLKYWKKSKKELAESMTIDNMHLRAA